VRPKYKYCLFPLDLPTHSNGPYNLLDMNKYYLFYFQ
jgi:hypothetical protein